MLAALSSSKRRLLLDVDALLSHINLVVLIDFKDLVNRDLLCDPVCLL